MTPKIYGYCQTSCENHNVYVSMNHMCETKMNTSDNEASMKKKLHSLQPDNETVSLRGRAKEDGEDRVRDAAEGEKWRVGKKTSYMGKCTDFHSVKSIINSGSCSGSPISTN